MSYITLVQWSARILSSLIVLCFGFFLVAHLIGDQGAPTRPLVWGDYVILATLIVSLAGLMVAWKWRFAGAAIALVAIMGCALVNWKILIFPGALIPVNALLFLISGWLGRASAHPLDPSIAR